MKFGGLQKLTLLDYPGKMACTVFTSGCNLRCPFCHNAGLVTHIDGDFISQQDLLQFLSTRKGKLEGLCLTGGEPLLNKDVAQFLAEVKEMGFSVKLDTNGTNPDLLKQLIDDKLVDYVAMDIKNSKSKYSLTCGGNVNIEDIEKSVHLLKIGQVDYEFRTTVVRQLHEQQDIEDIAQWLVGAKAWYLQQFVDSGDLIGQGMSAWDEDTMHKFAETANKYLPTFVRGIE